MKRSIVESAASETQLMDSALERSIIYVYDILCIHQYIWELNSQSVILPLIYAWNHSATLHIVTFTQEACIIFNNNCSLPPGNECCHQNGRPLPVTCTLLRKFEFLILNRYDINSDMANGLLNWRKNTSRIFGKKAKISLTWQITENNYSTFILWSILKQE